MIAVRGRPPEAKPGEDVSYDVLIASPAPVVDPPAAWSFCIVPKSLAENNVVADECLKEEANLPIGVGPSVAGETPRDTCRLFGPDTPPGMGELRPRDPDVTGGYYQPVRVTYGGRYAFGLERVSCDLADAGAEIAAEFRMRYHANTNPTLGELASSAPLDAIPAGADVTFTATWPADAVETYPVFDPAAQSLTDHRESMRVSWFATAGTFDADRTGRAEDDPELTTSNVWHAPTTPGPVRLWLVLRDSRGGVDFAAHDLAVVP